MPDEQEFSTRLENEADEEFSSGRTNNVSDIVCSVGAILASFAATVLAATGRTAWITAAVAAIPGALASLQRVVDFRGRASWYFVCAAQRRAFVRALEYEGASPKEVSLRVSEFEIEMEQQWARMIKSSPTGASK